MQELVYADSEVMGLIANKWPSAKFADATDMVHDERFSVEIPDIEESEFFRYAVREGFAMLCLGIRVHMYNPPEWMKKAIDELKAERKSKDSPKLAELNRGSFQ